ncbi:hypothetical protein LAZ40_05485 [Cereibacter sphaeroides]|uniref:hypothetical protein n=1 Tax=Cereibacter sphaeroides TaxID=1063 RepID=UPI001F3C98FD|nr:hypothetical protein [Cereibacter sphaeroides]MCE6958501.1 hypothetical protein [Cereibacter sphaeroides]MCE6972837.1 hypothetical protein [Cereibacter sphaeroides]
MNQSHAERVSALRATAAARRDGFQRELLALEADRATRSGPVETMTPLEFLGRLAGLDDPFAADAAKEKDNDQETGHQD